MIKGVFAHFFILSPRRKCYKSVLFFRSNRVGWVFWPGHLYAPSGTAGTGCPLRAAASPICGAQLRNCCRSTTRIPSQRAWHQTGDVVHWTVPRLVGCTHGVEPDWKSGPLIRKPWMTVIMVLHGKCNHLTRRWDNPKPCANLQSGAESCSSVHLLVNTDGVCRTCSMCRG